MWRTFILVLLQGLAVAGLRGAAPELSADEPIEFNAELQVLTARGNATFTDGEIVVLADEIRYFRRDNRIIAEGGVQVNQPGFRLLSERLEYSVETRRFESGPFRAGYPPLFLEGAAFEGTREEIDFSETTLYFKEPEAASPRASVRALRVRPEEWFAADGLRLGIGGDWRLPLPDVRRPFTPPEAAFRGQIGFRKNLGVFARSRTLLPAGESFSLGANFDLYSERGLLAGPALRFVRTDPDTIDRREVEVSSGLIRDHSRRYRGFDVLNAEVPRDRWFVEGSWRERSGPWRIAAAASIVRDSEMMRDFRPDEYDFAQQPDVFAEARYVAENWQIGLFTRFNPNDFHPMVERFPELRFDFLPQPLASSGFNHSAGVQVTSYRQSFFDPAFATRGDLPFPELPSAPPGGYELINAPRAVRATGFYRIDHPLELAPWLSFRPLAGFRHTWYDEGVGLKAGEAVDYWRAEIGFDLTAHAFATWDLRNRIWGVDGLRHIVRPLLRYRWQPTGGAASEVLPQFDTPYFSPVRPVLDLPLARDLDFADERHVLRFGIENLLQTRSPGGATRDLARFHLYQDLVLSNPAGTPDWEAFYLEITMRPAAWLQLDLAQRYRTEEPALNETRMRITLTSAEKWTASFTADYLEKFISQYGLAGFYRLNPRFGLFAQARYDARLREFTRHGYGLRQRIGTSWEIDYGVIFNRGTTREDDVQVALRVRLLSL